MTEYDTAWIKQIQEEREAEAPRECTSYPYYSILEWKPRYLPEGAGDYDAVEYDCEFYHDTPEDIQSLIEVTGSDYEPDKYDIIHDVADIVQRDTKWPVEKISYTLEPEDRANQEIFFTRAEAQRYLDRFPHRFLGENPHTYSLSAYQCDQMQKVLHLLENIDLGRSTIILKDA